MKMIVRSVILLGLSLAGCEHHPRRPLDIIVLIDISASIDGGAGRMELAANSVASRLKDGDQITVIPICDGGYTSAQAAPLYLVVSIKREAFNEELVRFRSQFKKKVETILAVAPCKKTAILKTIERAAMLDEKDISDKVLYIFTDGIEDSEISFYKDPRLGSSREAVKLADKLALTYRHLPSTRIRLGLIESKDFDNLPRERQGAVVVFWRKYLGELGKDARVEAPELLGD